MSPRLTRLSDVTDPARLPSYAPSAHGVGIVIWASARSTAPIRR